MTARAEIEVRAADGTGRVFEVVVREGRGETRHRVTVSEDDLRRFGGRETDPANLVKESFRFLLEREPKESILGRFELNVIERYFPEYPREIARRLQGGGEAG
jgi:hypothetical protein